MLKYIVGVVALIVCFGFASIVYSETLPEVVINSFRIEGESVKDEYVEIYNKSQDDISLSGWRLSKKTASGSNYNLVTTFPDIIIAAGAKIVIAHPDCNCAYDIEYTTSGSLAKDNSIVLYSDNGKTIVDMVAFGEIANEFVEGEPLINPEKGEVYSRKNDGQDTQNNKNDFFISYRPPQESDDKRSNDIQKDHNNEGASNMPNSYNAKLIVTEFLPNPEGSDAEKEFIEIYNQGPSADISGYYLMDLLGSPKKFKIPEGTKISSKSYLAFFSEETPISLNNSGDGVAILNPDGKIIDSSPDDCGKAPEGASFAFDGKKWAWTSQPTPGKPNVIKTIGKDDDSLEDDREVLSLIDEKDFSDNQKPLDSETKISNNDDRLGYVLITLAIISGISYTLYSNKEKVIEFAKNCFRKRDNSPWERIRKKMPRR